MMIKIYVSKKRNPWILSNPLWRQTSPQSNKVQNGWYKRNNKNDTYICSTVVHAEMLGIAVWPNSPAKEKNGKNEENPCH